MTAQRPYAALTQWVVLRLCMLWFAMWAVIAVTPQVALDAPVKQLQQTQRADVWTQLSEQHWVAAVGQMRSGRVEGKTALAAAKSGSPQPPKTWLFAQVISWLFQIHGPWLGYAWSQPSYFGEFFHLLQPRAPPRAWTFTGTHF